MNEYLLELENLVESNFNEDTFEDRAREISLLIKSCDEYIQLAALCRWVKFQDEQRAIDLAHDFIDRAVEICVSNKDLEKLEHIIQELEFGMELEERASEVREILTELESNS